MTAIDWCVGDDRLALCRVKCSSAGLGSVNTGTWRFANTSNELCRAVVDCIN
jgi:hypothetical protein